MDESGVFCMKFSQLEPEQGLQLLTDVLPHVKLPESMLSRDSVPESPLRSRNSRPLLFSGDSLQPKSLR